ncbi:two-component sensor histidine kinase [Streptomyces sp. 5-8]|uniref:histidine kinase n=1 Tax=Streptomyces musisoli TaxID=2802280 RepID=A0ABS1PDA7_9ACTN|nr:MULTISPECIES: histidine kinase [Streptomyces]MBL1110139.1 two-component sensor histidine kinase [Streptomyces musisoli]MBY8845985.1 two-component sensor histidine kinase [Streptomyces sp. SP2-10]
MEKEDRRSRHQQLIDALRPEAKAAPLSRRVVRTDVALAVVLTVIALFVAVRYPGDGPVNIDPKANVGAGAPAPPPPPVPGQAPVEDEPSPVPWALVVLSTLSLALRRRYPLTQFVAVLGAALAIGGSASWMTVLACVIGAYSAVVYSRYRIAAIAVLVIAAALSGVAFRNADPVLPGWSSPGFVLLVAGMLASLVRFLQLRLASSRDRVTQLQEAQEDATRRAVEEERARIAAELHDVVTHNVSVMVIQAGAARKVMDMMPEQSKEALLAVEAGGRAAMAELRHVMGLLAATDHERPDGLEPQPGLAQLDALVARVRAAGTPVSVEVSLPPDPLPPGVDLAAYRVVQEALTNTIKHARGAQASVAIGYTDDRLEIEVTDTDGAKESPPVESNGRGHMGLRERLAVYQGELTAGPAKAGGYRVTARIPRSTI